MSIRFSEEDVRPMGRVSTGVKGITLSEEDVVIDAVVLEDGADRFAITTKGYGKRTLFSKYRRIRRGGKGVKNIKIHPKRGLVVATKKIKKDEEMLIIITRGGKSIRLRTKNIRRIGRITAGVRIIKVDKNDEVIGIT